MDLRVELAWKYAKEAHKNQLYGDKPYFDYHIINVYNRVCEITDDINYHIVALLHDIIEDTDFDINLLGIIFGEDIKNAVLAITYNKKIETREEYYDRVLASPISKLVKYADASENMYNCYLENKFNKAMYYKKIVDMMK